MTTHPAARTLLCVAAALASLASCTTTPPPALPPAPAGVQEITVKDSFNHTGRDLVVDQPGLVGRYLDEKRSTVPQLLASDLRALLQERRFRVIHEGEGIPTLQTEIQRWEPYSADYSQVTVSLVATLTDPTNGRTLWTVARNNWRVDTSSARSAPEASTAAALEIARALLEGWLPGGRTPAATP